MGRMFANGPGHTVQCQVVSYQRFLKWYLIPPFLTLSDIRFVSRVNWNNPGKGVAPSSTPRCSSYWKGSLLVAHDYVRPRLRSRILLTFFYIWIYNLLLFSLPFSLSLSHSPTHTHTHYPYLPIFTNLSARAGYYPRSIFKRSLTGLKSELFS